MLNHGNVTALTCFQYRAGTPTTPNWTDFFTDQYELVEPDGNGMSKSGMIRIYAGFAPLLYTGTNAIRATYTAGFLISWPNFGDPTQHNLPADLSTVCENLVTRHWKHRESVGKRSESVKDSTSLGMIFSTIRCRYSRAIHKAAPICLAWQIQTSQLPSRI